MKQFNLEEYLKNPSKKVVTRDGNPAKIICTNFHLSGYPIIAEINDKKYGNKQSWSFDKNGQFDSCKNNGKDLFFDTQKHEGWVNIYRSESRFYLRGNPYKSKEKADEVAKANPKTFCTTVKIEWEE